MAPPSSTRRLPWSGNAAAAGGDAAELSRPRSRWQSVVLQIRRTSRKATTEGLFGLRPRRIMEAELMSMFLPIFGSMFQRVVSEEVEKAMFRQFSAPAAPPRLLVDRIQRPRYQLMFLNCLKPVYTMTKLESHDGTPLKVALVERLENNQTNIVRYGPLSSVRVEVVVLHGNFNAKVEESWSPEEFKKHIVSGRDKSAQLLTGNLTLKLNRGEALLENAIFTDNSSFTSTKMFRLGLRLLHPTGERVLEGVTKPFRVKERRVEGFEKHYPPMLNDEVWRLKKIGKNGAYHDALSDNGIYSVQKFLQAYMKDEQKLIKIFNKMPQSTWKSIIEHAMTCKLGDSLYVFKVKDRDASLFFDEIYQLVGVKFDDCYKPIDQLDQMEKNLVDSLKQVAYQNIDSFKSDYKMVNDYPVLHSFSTEGASLLSPVHSNQQMLKYGQHNSYPAGTSTCLGFEPRHPGETFNTSLAARDVPVDISRFVQGQTFNYMQLRHEPTINRVLPYNATQGALLPGPRVTQLQIPNSERTFFGPDVSPAVTPSNGDALLSEESYRCLPVGSMPSTDVVMSLMQSPFQLLRNSESSSNQSEQQNNHQTIVQPQFVTGFHQSRTNSFDLSSCDELVQNFISQISSNEGASTPLSPRKWVKIRAALKLASVGRLSRISRGSCCNPLQPRLVPTI